jgi:hypothetical protein
MLKKGKRCHPERVTRPEGPPFVPRDTRVMALLFPFSFSLRPKGGPLPPTQGPASNNFPFLFFASSLPSVVKEKWKVAAVWLGVVWEWEWRELGARKGEDKEKLKQKRKPFISARRKRGK